MKAEEKQLLFNLLKTSSSYVNGYTKPIFNHTIEFTDDKPSIALNIEQLNSKVLKCNRCSLNNNNAYVSLGNGVNTPEVLVIKDNSSSDQNTQNEENTLLEKMLASINLSVNTNCYITQLVKCQPLQNREINSNEQDSCFSFLEAQIKVLKPKIIFCLGRLSTCKLLNTQNSIGSLHGHFFEYTNIPLIATYHPSALLKNQDLKRYAWEDLKTLRIKLNQLNS